MITPEQFHNWIEDLRAMYQSEEDQAILQRNMDKAIHALAGKDACTRLANYLPMRAAMAQNVSEINARKK